MRTRVTIDDGLLKRAKERAARTGRTLGAVIDEALRVLLVERPGADLTVELPTDGGTGLRPGVDLADKEALAALLDEAETA